MPVKHFYLFPGLPKSVEEDKVKDLKSVLPELSQLQTEICFNVGISSDLSQQELDKLKWLLSPPFSASNLKESSQLKASPGSCVIEIGPRLNFSTPYSSNAVSICKAIGLNKVDRLEISNRYLIKSSSQLQANVEDKIVNRLHDRMTQCRYTTAIQSFDHGITPENWSVVDVMQKGRKALEEVNDKLGLAFDDWDLDFYTQLFKDRLKRNPTTVECFDLAQSNSEHSRHWFFKGQMIVDGVPQPKSLIDMIIETQESSNPNNIIKFSDNSSAIKGFTIEKFTPERVFEASRFGIIKKMFHIVFTAETHNFPTGVAPFSGATTGTGGRIRDVQAVGRGGHCIAGTAGYSVGNLYIPGYAQPWEESNSVYPPNFAHPLDIIVEASSGASDYGNKFGEPLICGFTRSFGLKIGRDKERYEFVKPIMFSGGVGSMEEDMTSKLLPTKGMKVAKIGGPVYRIGVGGGSASSVQVQGDNQAELDFGAVQRGDAEMENKLNRIIRGCIENKGENPICSIHDQGAGGNGNVLKEIVEPEGAVIFTNAFTLGDNSLSTLELWGAEYQENNAILLHPKSVDLLQKLSHRERCPVNIVGVVTGNGKVILSEEKKMDETPYLDGSYKKNMMYPFNLDLELVLGKMPRKEFHMVEEKMNLTPLNLPSKLSIMNCLNRVLRLVSVSSKRFLTNKVDRCVTGLVAQQQCVGPLHTPLADYALTALSIFNTEGVATAIGEQPIKGLLDPAAGARMTVAESITNLMFAKITCLEDVKCSGNWMWAAKLPGEGAKLYRACEAMCSIMKQLGVAIDGGKDSLSMAARIGKDTIKAPGTLVVSTYAPCPDIRIKVTPDIKGPLMGKVGVLLWIKLSNKNRLGGSALAQTFSQIGDSVPDVDCPEKLRRGFNVTQKLLSESKILSGHDVSDGGLITCILEMAFAGMSGLQIQTASSTDPIELLFAEEVGWVIEVAPEDVSYVTELYTNEEISCVHIGQTVGFGMNSQVTITNEYGNVLLSDRLHTLMKLWEETSYRLECRQAAPKCVSEEFNQLQKRKGQTFRLTFDPNNCPKPKKLLGTAPRVAVIREEGTNGDREMAASLFMVGFDVWDVSMQDLLDGKVTSDHFRGIIFPGGFSYADVLGSAKGWAASFKYNPRIKAQMDAFIKRNDTFSLGVCNGCQLMALLGWIVPFTGDVPSVALDHNLSGRFECRFSSVRIEKSSAIMCKGMEGSILGVWVAHGEGRFTFKDEETKRKVMKNPDWIPFKYADDEGNPTEMYPLNPNGSHGGVAGICSDDGRHLAFMPHPERCTQAWQWPYLGTSLSIKDASPWVRFFHNAFVWANEVQME